MEVSLKEFKNAKKGDILVYDGKYWQPQKSEDLTKAVERRVSDLEKANEGRGEIERIKLEKEKAERYAKHFSKEHFALVFNHVRFILVSGIEDLEIEVDDFLPLYDKVMNNESTVEESINRFQVLKDSFIK
ncbi:hypothetical protein EOM57_05520, partial [Candidatus Saccharibacteria bacterium]|nr:hypothetical protein [Candidatus Saccharibacteria bacterium]